MMRARSLMQKAVLVAVLAALFLLALPAMAQEDQGSTTTSSVVSENLTPAVPIETPVTPPATPDWTYRYLIPTGLVLAGLVVVVTSIRYFTNVVRKRYRIVEE
ncbi:MAG: hypothetical protein J5I28_06840 [Acidimicrobiales bacterium]|jgi:hypothetical protein|nr:hypothetical protein [Acidimicrobiales bacterium]HLV89441.1 hypothetical protein [Acidimicrobiia bacterium]